MRILFLWMSKRNKAKRQIVTQVALKGGLKMLDIYNFVCSLKCSWIKRLILNYKPWNRGGGAVGYRVHLASERLGVRIPAATYLSRKKHLVTALLPNARP